MKKLIFIVLALVSVLCAQSAPPYNQQNVVTATPTTFTILNPYGGLHATFEEIPTGTPATVSVAISGCMRGGTCDTAADTNTSTSAAIRGVTFTKPYNYFSVTASWTGGTNPTIKINALIVQ